MIRPMKSKIRISLILLFVILYVASAIKVVHKAKRGKGAFVRQAEYQEMIDRKEVIYDSESELYPNLPMMLLIQKPFHAMGPVWGSVVWLTLKFLIILFIFLTVAKVAGHNGPAWPDWALVALLLLNIRVFAGDLTHANVNLVTGGLIVAALLCSFANRDFFSGMAIGFATTLRVTPALFVLYFIYKRRWVGVGGAIVGVFLFLWLVPGLALGFEYNDVLTREWFKQMVYPYLAGAPAGPSFHSNQSFNGLFQRFLTDSVAVRADIEKGYEEVRINLVSWDYQTVSFIVRMASLLLVGCLAWFCRTPGSDRKHPGNLGEYAMVFLATLLISPRSWKHHYILLILAHGFILYYLISMKPSRWRKWVPLYSLLFASACFLLFSDSTLGHYWSNVAEAYGVYVIGGLSLFVGCAAVLTTMRLEGWSGYALRSLASQTGPRTTTTCVTDAGLTDTEGLKP